MESVCLNTLYLLTPGSYVSRDHLTLRVASPSSREGSASPVDCPENKEQKCVLSIPIHHLDSICVFGASAISAPALSLCWDNGVAVNFLSETGYFQARVTGVADSSVVLRRAQFRAADDAAKCVAVARQIIAGKVQNSRSSLLRASREADEPEEESAINSAIEKLGQQIRTLPSISELNVLRGAEGTAAQAYFSVFRYLLKNQREDFLFITRSRRPPTDRINCLLSYLYALVRHDCASALTSVGLDPFVGFLHADRPNRPSLALDLMEEFRPWLADRLAITLINRRQLSAKDIIQRAGGAVELSDKGRRLTIKAYQERKLDMIKHPLLNQQFRIGQLPHIQARIMARWLRGDIAEYVPFIPK